MGGGTGGVVAGAESVAGDAGTGRGGGEGSGADTAPGGTVSILLRDILVELR